MLTIEQCRSLLPDEVELSDIELESIRDNMYSTAELAFEVYWSEIDSGSKNPLGLLKVMEANTSI
jgi:hypothetical protein